MKKKSDTNFQLLTAKEALNEKVSLDFWKSSKLADIEQGINNTLIGVRVASLAIGIALARIEKEKLYIQSGCKSATEYFKKTQFARMPHSTISEYKKIGLTYLNHQETLQSISFTEKMGVKKLLYLDTALENHPEEETYKNLLVSTFKDFKEYAKKKKGQKSKNKTISHLKATVNSLQKAYDCRIENDSFAVRELLKQCEAELEKLKEKYI